MCGARSCICIWLRGKMDVNVLIEIRSIAYSTQINPQMTWNELILTIITINMYFSCNSTTANTHPVGKYLLSHGPLFICLFVSYSSIHSLSTALQTRAQFQAGRCKHIKVVHAAGSRGPPVWFIGQNIDENKHKTSDWYYIKGMIFGCRMKRSTMLLYVFERDKPGC